MCVEFMSSLRAYVGLSVDYGVKCNFLNVAVCQFAYVTSVNSETNSTCTDYEITFVG